MRIKKLEISKYVLALLLATIAFISNAQEICDNGIDDDGDGLIDCFDGDCSGISDCSTFYFGKDSGDCQIAPPVVTGYNLVEKWRSVVDVETRGTPIVGDLDGDGIPEVVTHFRDDNTVYIIDGTTGATKYTINAHLSEYSQSPAIADVDNDGFGEIFLVDHFGKLRCFDHQGNPKVGFNEITISEGQGTFQGVYAGNPSFADFNGDGISEIFIGNQIFNSITGLVTAQLPNLYNESKGAIGVNGHMYSAAFDILPDNFCTDCSGMELICGNVVYSVNITTGVLTEVSKAPNSVNDGKVSLADWDGDNKMDIIVSGTCCGDGGVIYIWNPRTQAFVTHDAQGNPLDNNPFDVQPDQNTQVGLASIADFDGDGFLEMGMAGRNEFITIESNMTRKWGIPVVDQSNMTTSTAFDFEGDGKTEVVYRDENFLYILDGATGAIITKTQCGSGTRTELPIVVDVNGDGDAELVCTCSDVSGGGKGQVRVYESDSTIWVPTRKVWNTHNYVPTFINDDLTVPKEFQNKALIDGQDLYLAQTSLTYKSGNPVYPVLPDYTIALDSLVTNCNQNTGIAHVKVCQVNSDALVFDFDISFYKGDPLSGGTLIGTKRIDNLASTIPSAGCMVTTYLVNAENYDLHVYVNDQGTNPSNSPIVLMPECDTTNNLATYPVSACNIGCETPIIGSVNAKIAAWQYIGEVTEGLNYQLESIGGSNSFTATNGPDAGEDVFAVVFNTSHGGQVSLNRTRYFSNDLYRDVLTGTYDNSPHVWTGLNGGEKAPILGYIAFIDLDGNGDYNSGTDIYYRDINSLSFDALSNGDLYMAFYDDGTYSDNSSTITISSAATNCPTDLAISKTDGVSAYQRSSNTIYTIVAKNNGPVDIENATVSDPIPNGINSFTWTAVLHGTATNSAGSSGGGAIIDNVNLAVGDSIVYTVTAAVSGTKFGDLENTVTISTPNGTEDLDSTNNVAIDIDADPDPTSCFILMTDFEDYVNCTAPSYDLFTQAYAGNSSWVNSNHTAGLFVNDPGICTNTNGLILPHIDGGNAYAGLHSPLNGNTQEVIIGTLPTNLFANQEYEISFIGVSILVRNQAIWDEYGEVEFFGIEEGTNPVLNTITQKNGTTIRAIPEVDHIGTSTTVNSRVQWNEYSFKFTPTRNYDRLLLAPRGNFAYVGIDNIVVKVAAQDIEIDTVTICSGTTNTVLPYNIISGTPDEYAIDWDNAANMAGISDVVQTTLPVDSQFVLSELTSVPAGSYTAEVTVYNTQLGCQGVDSIIFIVNPNPNVLLRTDTTICFGNNVLLDAGVQDSIVWSFGGATTKTIAVDETNEYIAEVYNDFGCSDTDSVQIIVEDCPVNLIYADTLIICKGDTALIEAMHMIDPIWSTDRQVTVNDSTIKAYPEETSVYPVERTLIRKDLLVNSDFEDVNLPGTNAQLDASLVDGWNTTAIDNKIEIWRDGFLGHPAYSGTFFAELNATQPSALYQDVETTEGEIIKWGFAHRGRVTAETMQLKIGPPDGPYEIIGDFTDGPTAWRYYSGEYIVPDGQTDTRFLFSAVDLNAAANLIDAPSFEAVIRHEDSVVVVVKICETDLAVTKTDAREDYTPGTTTEYTIVVKNHGPYDALDVVIDDPLPTGISNGDVSWDATVSGGAVSGVIGSQAGALNDIADIPVGDSIIYSVNIAIPTDYKGDLINTVTIFSELDSNPANDVAIDTDFNGLCVGATISSFAEQFNTGVKINAGENDPNWKIQWINNPAYHVYTANSYATPISSAVIPAVGMNKAAGVWGDASYPDYLWVCYPWTGTNNGPGKHVDVDGDGISQEYSGGSAISGTGDAVNLNFSKTFEMTAAQLEASELSFSIAADNEIMDIIVNGVSQGPKFLGSYQLIPHKITQDFQLGTNTIEIIVNSGPGYAGMMIANSTIKAVDSVSLIVTNPPIGCAPVVVDITDSLWTVGSVNAPDLIYFEDSAALIPYATPETADSGVYYIVGINEVGCSDTAKINIGQNPLPNVELSDTAFCDGKEVILDAGVFKTWEWNVGGEIGQTITVDSTDVYKVVVSNIFNCLDSDSVLVTVHELPEVIVNDTIICIGDTIQIPAISNTAIEYLWMQKGAGTSQTTEGAKVGTYEVIITDINGCKDTSDAELAHHISPTVTVNNDTICIDESDGQFSAISTTAISYVWSENARGVLATTSGSKPGNYTVIVEDVNSCKDTATGVLHVDTLPIVFVADTVICSNVPSVEISAESTTAKFYEWGGTGIGNTKSISAIDAGNYTIIVTDENGCKQQSSANLYRVDQPELFEIEGDSLACEGDEIELLISVTTDNIEWSTGEEGQNIITTETGEYSVITTNEGYGITCSEGNSKEVEFLPFPILPDEEEFINCFDYLNEITIKISSPAQIVWDGSESSRPDSNLVITQEGVYNATLYHYPMCPITVQREVIEFCPMTFFIPNAFTPNGDGLNDTFEPKMSNIETYKIMIFNRWGELIFTSNDPSNQWDGTVNSNEVQIDVYVYKIVVTGFYQIGNLDSEQLVGTVTVIR